MADGEDDLEGGVVDELQDGVVGFYGEEDLVVDSKI